MKNLVLGPEDVREALNPQNFPKRHVFMVTLEGDILCCDVDEGWLAFRRPRGLTNRQWAKAVRAAVDALNHQALVARSIHDDIEERTEPGGAVVEPAYVHHFR